MHRATQNFQTLDNRLCTALGIKNREAFLLWLSLPQISLLLFGNNEAIGFLTEGVITTFEQEVVELVVQFNDFRKGHHFFRPPFFLVFVRDDVCAPHNIKQLIFIALSFPSE